MSGNGAGFRESIVHSPIGLQAAYSYRSKMGMMPSAEYAVMFDDFNRPIAANLPSEWLAAIIDVGATLTTSTVVGAAGATGGALIASDGASEGVAIYKPVGIQLTAGKRFFMEARVQTSNAAQTEVQIGLTSANAVVNPEDLWTTASNDVVAFGTLPGSEFPVLLSDKANSGTVVQTQALRSLSNNTQQFVAIYFDGVGLSAFVDGKQVIRWSGAGTTIPTGVALAPFVGARTGATAANTTTFDLVRYVIER